MFPRHQRIQTTRKSCFSPVNQAKGVRRRVSRDCVHHHPVRESGGGFPVVEIPRYHSRLAARAAVCGGESPVSGAANSRYWPSVSGRKFRFPDRLMARRGSLPPRGREGGAGWARRIAVEALNSIRFGQLGVGALNPSATHCCGHAIGRSVRRLTPFHTVVAAPSKIQKLAAAR